MTAEVKQEYEEDPMDFSNFTGCFKLYSYFFNSRLIYYFYEIAPIEVLMTFKKLKALVIQSI